MKKLIIKAALPMIFEYLIAVLGKLALKTDNEIDDALVQHLEDNKDEILSEMESML